MPPSLRTQNKRTSSQMRKQRTVIEFDESVQLPTTETGALGASEGYLPSVSNDSASEDMMGKRKGNDTTKTAATSNTTNKRKSKDDSVWNNSKKGRKHSSSGAPTPEDTSSRLIVNSDKQQAKKEDSEGLKMDKMVSACKTILECMGENPEREGLEKTPERWAKALLFLTHGYNLSCKEVTNGAVFEENHREMVVVRNIDIHSLCEHHMLPFSGKMHVGYIPNGRIIGLSKLARIAEVYARRLQVQERLTREIADAIEEAVAPLGVAVVIESSHFCMVMRGVQKVSADTVTSSVRGCFKGNSKTRTEFFSILNGGPKMC
eukprot:CAMPEP_0118686556 /NCGR_PEP_ID=MMETSP0800-20121206/7878_1 /TAXON_ID=210618 ORGANISM="Striatella unipunctata, Strain CCMP2910" /NCGR_SAMPLE_ID=MMETSP0800 /ASSEMBLY_ACC=CAM_ASM_000638 /LENGTH=318 /DNA_ID=CAMNT_0006583613 /DNA_START=126 /DNA_END=1082 /DNA_ORIENTATION=-